MNPNEPTTITTEVLERMKKMVLKNLPQIREIENNYGTMPYFQYVKQKNRMNLHKPFQQRKKEMIKVIKDETTRLLGSKIGTEVETQLKRNDSISTAEHTAPISTPHGLGAGLSVAVPMFENTDPRYKNVIILSCSGTSFNNFLSLARGFLFHTFKDQQITDNQITFFGRAADPKTVLFHPPYSYESILEMKKTLNTLVREEKVQEQESTKIQEVLDEIYLSPHALSAGDYCDQLAITNYYLWQKLFPSFSAEQIPNYVMLSQEKILIELLLEYHIDSDTPIQRFIFNPGHYELIEKYFDGISGAFNKAENIGTFLFWGVNESNLRLQLVRDGDSLVSLDGTFRVKLEPKAIREALMKKQLFPSVLLTFVTFAFYYGFLLGGGAKQPTYLTSMKDAYKAMMKEVGDNESYDDADHAVTDDFVFLRPHLAFIEVYGIRLSATGLDMLLYGNPQWEKIIEATKTITMSDFITILLPILYKQFCPEDQKEEALMNISRQQVEKFIEFDKKLPALSTIA